LVRILRLPLQTVIPNNEDDATYIRLILTVCAAELGTDIIWKSQVSAVAYVSSASFPQRIKPRQKHFRAPRPFEARFFCFGLVYREPPCGASVPIAQLAVFGAYVSAFCVAPVSTRPAIAAFPDPVSVPFDWSANVKGEAPFLMLIKIWLGAFSTV
jgi:hypothetical protein